MGSTDEPIPAPAPEGTAPPEHWRYARHLDALAAAAAAGTPAAGSRAEAEAEACAVAAVLRDPDPVMAESAVVTHLDRRAVRLLHSDGFADWAAAMSAAVAGRAFAAGRLREWVLLKAVVRGEPWSAEELARASDWCQRTAVRSPVPPEALVLLAGAARTRLVRNGAAQRLRRASATA
ncbi:hypothetical protein [Streptomyces globosus]|uniref:hypothetical protein n=1 Tax=Streptomyces globosus TaxID=68209 RepID=UPI0013B3C65E|nr:hypothetical protein [Streptomyces globosus]